MVGEESEETTGLTSKTEASLTASVGVVPRYVGLDASLLHLRQIWASSSSGPFEGVLGFGRPYARA